MIQRLFYQALKGYCWVVLHFYFRRWQVQKIAKVPKGPIIFVSNHQNAFLDAVLIACSSFRNPWFLARANVFDKPLVRKALAQIQMHPVYRFRDGFKALRKSDETMSLCIDLLSKNKSILIFGEGNHNPQYNLLPLQKGFARIGLAAEEKNNWSLGVQIVPVGLHYESHTKFRSRVLVSFGNPIPLSNFKNDNNSQFNFEPLLEETAKGIRQLTLNIPKENYQEHYEKLIAYKVYKKDLIEQIKSDQRIVTDEVTTPIQPGRKKQSSSIWRIPFDVYERINNFFPRLIIRWIVKTKINDSQFIGSIKFSVGMLLVPTFYLIQTMICYVWTESELISGIYLFSLPLSVSIKR
jgi:1-acyl-sn-glycerol-3-phosphate acyltransferase